MPNVYSQVYMQFVFAVKGRQSILPKINREELHKYITGIVQKRGHKMLAIYCMADHIHILIGLKPAIAISDLVRDVKTFSSTFINENKWVQGRFQWQEGYGVFSYSRSQIDMVIKYIMNQEEHHKKKTFKAEYLKILNDLGVEYEDKYLFEWIDDMNIDLD